MTPAPDRIGTVYLLHFTEPISDRHTTQHYLGYADRLEARIAHHRAGTGARLTQVARERGISFFVATTWEGGRALERRLKGWKKHRLLCSICRTNRA